MNGIERRKHPRVTISVDVDFESGSNFYTGRARDISEGGVFIESPLFAPVGTLIELTLCLSGHRHSHIPGEVAWVLCDDAGTALGFGVRFLELRRPIRRAVREFMRARAPIPFELLEADEAPESEPPPAPPSSPSGPRSGPRLERRSERVRAGVPPPLPT